MKKTIETWLNRYPSLLPILFGIVLICLRFFPFFFGNTVLFGDNFSLMVPGKLFTAQWLAQGILPLWNPMLFAGIPWIGDVNQSILYPSTLFFLIFSPAVSLNITILIHQILTFIGMYLLAGKFVKHRWLMLTAAILWTFSPQVASTFNNISTSQSISWMPWVILAGLSIGKGWNYKLFFAGIVMMQFAGGYPQHVLYSILTAVVLSGWMSRSAFTTKKGVLHWFANWVTAALMVIGMTAIFWLPFLETLRDSTRSIQTEDQAASGSLRFVELIKIAFPYLFDNPMAGMKWGPSWNLQPNVVLYFSWIGLLVVGAWVFSPRSKKTADDWFFLAASGFFLFLSMGENLPFYSLTRHLPVLQNMRAVSTILVIPTLLISLWIVILVERLSFAKNRVLLLAKMFLLAAVLIAIFYILQLNWFTGGWRQLDEILSNRLSTSAFHTVARDQVITASFLKFFAIVLSLSSALLWTYAKKKYVLVVILLAAEMTIMTQGHYRYGSNSVYTVSPDEQTVESLLASADLTNYRVLTRNYNAPYSDFGAYYEAMIVRPPFSDSYIDQAELNSYTHLRRMRDGATPDWNEVMSIPIINGYTTLLPLSMHADFIDGGDSEASINDLPPIKTTDSALQKWSTRYYVVDTWFPTYDEVFPEKIVAENAPWVVYELPDVLSRFRYEDNSPIRYSNFSENPNHISFSFINESNNKSILIADRYDSNWQAKVNGVEVPITNFESLRKIAIPAGVILLEMNYVPQSFYRGVTITLITVCLVIAILTGKRLMSKRRSPSS